MSAVQAKKSDLKVRVLSAIVMVTVAGAALWLGGRVWAMFLAAVGVGVLWEWWGLVRKFVSGVTGRTLWMFGGLAYIGSALAALLVLRGWSLEGWIVLGCVILGVIGTDVGAYFVGRTFGGPKIAPKISPSKTWSGLGGGILGALLGMFVGASLMAGTLAWPRFGIDLDIGFALSKQVISDHPFGFVMSGMILAVVAQSGDFFQSWMKRRAGVKDSGKLIPGHGGLFDRADGMLAVLFALVVLSSTLFVPAALQNQSFADAVVSELMQLR